jgi:glycosyltransferase involved in cell wall biosynthesis
VRIVIDLQGAQSGSRFRGIGRYSLSLALAMVRNAGSHEIHVVLNGRFEDSIEPIIKAFGDTLPADRFHIWLPVRTAGLVGDDGVDERLREAFLQALKPDIVHVSSLFEGLGEPAITSIGVGSTPMRTAVTLFDLIPLIYRKRYLDNPVMARWYHGKIAQMRRADLLLGISASAAQEAVDHLGFDADGVVNISSAIDEGFQRLGSDALDEAAVRGRYALTRPFVMYTGGIDHRKNIEGLIRAYAKLPKNVRSAHQLAIVCSVHEEPRRLLTALMRDCGLREDEVVLTGFVPEEDLVALYNIARLFVFPSWHEGFGLPALEAMQCGAPVIGAATSSLPEVIGLEEALFDPYDDLAIMQKMAQGLTDEAFRARLLAHAPVQALKFSWDASAIKAIAAMEACCERPLAVPRPRLAYVSPMPPERSGIADYSAELVPELARFYEIDVILTQPGIDDHAVEGTARVRDLAWFQAHGAGYDRVIYHFGNSMYHAHMVEMLERVPGVVVLHDFFLSGLFAYRELAMGMRGTWNEALYRSHGYVPMPAKADRQHEQLMQDYPCNFTVLSAAQGVVVHSAVSRRMAQQYYPCGDTASWREVPLMRAPAFPGTAERRAARAALGLPENAFVVCSFGFMAPSKQNARLVDAWLASPLAKDERCHLVFVGQADPNDYGHALERSIQSSPAGKRIHITGFAERDDFRRYLMAGDVAVQLRTFSRGETSAAVLDAMNHGLATVVNANGAMADLPDHVVIKLPDAFDDASLQDALVTLYRDDALRARLSADARAFMLDVHGPRRCAEAYHQAIEAFHAAAQASPQALVTSLGRYLAHGGGMVDEAALGQAMAWSFPAASTCPQALVDIDALSAAGNESALERLRVLLLAPPPGWRIEPVTCRGDGVYHYARKATLALLGCPDDMLADDPVDAAPGDLLLGMPGAQAVDSVARRHLRWTGVQEANWDDWAPRMHAG